MDIPPVTHEKLLVFVDLDSSMSLSDLAGPQGAASYVPRRMETVKRAALSLLHCKQRMSFYHEFAVGELRREASISGAGFSKSEYMINQRLESLRANLDPVGPLDFSSVLEKIDDYLPKGEDRGKFTLHAVLLHGRPDVPEMSAQRKAVVERVLSDPGFFMDVLCIQPVAEDLAEEDLKNRDEQVLFFERILAGRPDGGKGCSVVRVESEYDLFKSVLLCVSHPLQRVAPVQQMMNSVRRCDLNGMVEEGGEAEAPPGVEDSSAEGSSGPLEEPEEGKEKEAGEEKEKEQDKEEVPQGGSAAAGGEEKKEEMEEPLAAEKEPAAAEKEEEEKEKDKEEEASPRSPAVAQPGAREDNMEDSNG